LPITRKTEIKKKTAAEIRGQITLAEKYANVSSEAFEAMLRLIYYNDENIEMLHACQLYLFAHDYNLVKLSLLIEKIIGGGEVTSHTVLPLLDVAYNPLMEENRELQSKLKDIGMKFVVQNIDKMDFAPLQYMSPVIGTQILQQIQSVLSPNWRSMDVNIAKSKGSPQEFEDTSDSDVVKSKSDPKIKNKGSESSRKPKSKPITGKKDQPPSSALAKKKKT